MLTGRVHISDTTLRDGEQTYGIVFSNLEKLHIAQLLCEASVNEIEAGFPSQEGNEQAYLKRLLELKNENQWNTRIIGWNRPVQTEIEASIELGIDGACSSTPVTKQMIESILRVKPDEVLRRQELALQSLKGAGLYTVSDFQDAYSADREFLFEMIQMSEEAGADRVRLCDTVGRSFPHIVYELLSSILERFKLDIEVHAHNDLGMASANCIAGVKALSDWIERNRATNSDRKIYLSTTVNGIGERAGNTDLATIATALDVGFGVSTINHSHLSSLSKFVSIASSRPVPVNAPVVGINNWCHSSGIHVDGVIKDSSNYELISPEYVGLPVTSRKLGLNKHSGKRAVVHYFSRLGVDLDSEQSIIILGKVQNATVANKRMLTDAELLSLVREGA